MSRRSPRFSRPSNAVTLDLILADYTLPSFDGLSALTAALRVCPHVPFIFVSGTLGEEVAIEALKMGATDYVLKTNLSQARALGTAGAARSRRAGRTRACGRGAPAERDLPGRSAAAEPHRQLRLECRQRRHLLVRRDVPHLRVRAVHHTDDGAGHRARPTRMTGGWSWSSSIAHPRSGARLIRTSTAAAGRFDQTHSRGGPPRRQAAQPAAFEFVGAVTDITRGARSARHDLEEALREIKLLKDQLQEENVALKEEIDKASMFEEIVGESPALQAVLARVAKVAPDRLDGARHRGDGNRQGAHRSRDPQAIGPRGAAVR